MPSTLFSSRLFLVPLFQGFSRLDFLDIVEKTPLDFRTYRAGEVIVRQGDQPQSLCILLGGEAEAVAQDPEQTYVFSEKVRTPCTVQIEALFGLHNRYIHTFKACGEVQVLRIDKQSVRRLLMDYPAFQINFYNALSTLAQQRSARLWLRRRDTPEGRFRIFMHRRSLRPVGEKTLHIRMEDLALELGTTRLTVSRMLADLAARGVLEHSRGVIRIPELEKL